MVLQSCNTVCIKSNNCIIHYAIRNEISPEFLKISYRTKKLEKTLNSEKQLQRMYGPTLAQKIISRLSLLRVVDNLGEVPTDRPFRLHKLTGDRKGRFAIDLDRRRRLIIAPSENSISKKSDLIIEKSSVVSVMIIEIIDYH